MAMRRKARTNEGGGSGSFWTTVPGILTGVAGLLTAVVALIGLLHALNVGAGAGSTRASGGGAAVSSPSARATSSAPVSGVLSSGRLTMREQDHADLEHGRINNAGDYDIYFVRDTVGASVYGAFVAPVQSTPARADCEAALAGRRDPYEYISQVGVGSWVCVHTLNGHLAAVQIVSYQDTTPLQLVITFTTWR
jgi:hypothetical protein